MIGKVIKKLLTDDTTLSELIPEGRIFPYIINEDTPLPAIIYTVDSVSPEYDKDGYASEEINFSVVMFSENYGTLQSIISAVRGALELKSGDVVIDEEETISIRNIYMTGQTEGYNMPEDIYLCKMTFYTTRY